VTENTAIKPAIPGAFVKNDPRAYRGGRMPKAMAEAKAGMYEYVPDAIAKLWKLTSHDDPKIQLAAVVEWLDRTLGKPKPMDADTEANVRAELKSVFTKLRERLSPAVYDQIIEVVTEK
jgi:hypothetical protein